LNNRTKYAQGKEGFVMLKQEWSCAAAHVVQQQSIADHMNSNARPLSPLSRAKEFEAINEAIKH
jgi:hypothetical protein